MKDRIENARNQFGNFDLGRLTAVGWLLFVLSIGVPAAIGLSLVEAPRPGTPADSRGLMKLKVIPFLLAMVGLFVGGAYALNRIGLTAVRPPKPAAPTEPPAA